MNATFYIEDNKLKCFGDKEVSAPVNTAALKAAVQAGALYLEEGEGWLLDVVRNPGMPTLALLWHGKLYEQQMAPETVEKLFA